MYAALLKNRLVLAVQEASQVINQKKKLNYEKYLCPRCHKQVILIISENKNAFFKHLIHYQQQQGEKEEHHNSKMLIKSAFTAAGFNAKVEIPLASGKIRADILISDKLAIEVQCAPLSSKEFYHRHHLYQSIQVLDLWIVGKRHFLKNKIRQTQLIYFRKNKQWGDYYLEVDIKREILVLKYNVQIEPLTSRVKFQRQTFGLNEKGIEKLWNFEPILKSYSIDPKVQKEYLQKQIQRKTKKGLQYAELLYQHQKTLNDLPESLFRTWRLPGQKDILINLLTKKSN